MLHRKKPPNYLGSVSPPFDDGNQTEKSKVSVPQEDNAATVSKTTSRKVSPLSVTPEFPLTGKRTTSKDKLNFYAQNIPEPKLLQRLEADSILNGSDSSLFWSEYIKEMSHCLPLPTQTGWLDSVSPLLSGSVSNVNANSWFSMNLSSLPRKNSSKIFCPSSTVSLLGFTDCENTKSKPKKSYKKNPRNRSKKEKPNSVSRIRVFPSKELHKVWKQWLAAYRWLYNQTIDLLGSGAKPNIYEMQATLRSFPKPDWVKALPGHQLQEAVADACDAYQQALANNGSARFKSCRATSQVIKFKPGNFKNGTWYPRATKGLSFTSPQEIPTACEYGTQLVYCRHQWFACFPTLKPVQVTLEKRVIALDPGVRTFLTGYDGETILEVGGKDIGAIHRLCLHLDQLCSRISTSKSQRQRYKMRKAASRLRGRIQNLVKDLHAKTASFLVRHYKVIFLPTFETSQMSSKSTRKIQRKSVRSLLTWSHYRFAQHLQQAANRQGVLVVRCNESYTSKTCPECGHIHEKLAGSKTFKCPQCGYQAPRDWHGARNIMFRALQATAVIFRDDAVLFQGLGSDTQLCLG